MRMKKFLVFIISAIIFASFSACKQSPESNSSSNSITVSNPITSISTSFDNQTLLLGEVKTLEISSFPLDNDDCLSISVADDSIISLSESNTYNKIIKALKPGETSIILSNKTESLKKIINIRVIDSILNSTAFLSSLTESWNKFMVTVDCDYYDSPNGKYQDVCKAFGTIIAIKNGICYCLTDNYIFSQDQIGSYKEGAILTNHAIYPVLNLYSDENSRLAICAFKPNNVSDYESVTIQKNVFIGDYALSPSFPSELTRVKAIEKRCYNTNAPVEIFFCNHTKLPSEKAYPIFNQNRELIGICLNNSLNVVNAISGYEISRVFSEMSKQLVLD